jgi:hypothetical protein
MSMIRCRRSYIPILAVTALLLSAPASGAPPMKSKPQLPVQIKIEAAQPGVTPDSIKPGEVVDLIVSAISFADTDAMTITVILPEGAVLISGDLSWTGPARKGEKKTMPITVRVPQKGTGEIKADMSIRIEGRQAFSASSRFAPGEAKKRKPEQKRPVKKDSKGEDVIEYR